MGVAGASVSRMSWMLKIFLWVPWLQEQQISLYSELFGQISELWTSLAYMYEGCSSTVMLVPGDEGISLWCPSAFSAPLVSIWDRTQLVSSLLSGEMQRFGALIVARAGWVVWQPNLRRAALLPGCAHRREVGGILMYRSGCIEADLGRVEPVVLSSRFWARGIIKTHNKANKG